LVLFWMLYFYSERAFFVLGVNHRRDRGFWVNRVLEPLGEVNEGSWPGGGEV